MDEGLRVQQWSVVYDKAPVLWDITFAVPKGSIVGILGPNGAGKSTLLTSILGLIKPKSGTVSFLGADRDKMRDKIAYVSQRSSVDWDFPVTVFEVVLMGCYGKRGLFGRIRPEDRKLAAEALEAVGMTALADRQIGELSGGQQQKVFLARAIAQQAEIYFLDEPFAGIDLGSEQTIVALLQELRSQGKTIFVVHHDLYSVREYFDWILFINTTLIAAGPVQETFSKENLLKTYGRSFSFLEAELEIKRL